MIDIFNKESGIIYFEAGAEIDDEIIDFLNNEKIEELKILDINNDKQRERDSSTTNEDDRV